MELTHEMEQAFELIETTNDPIFITGKAGSGKTTFLQYVVKHTKKQCVVAAPTGIAAIHAGGCTLHSLFNLPFTPVTPLDKLSVKINGYKMHLIKNIELLIIDEVSMVRPDILDTIDRRLRFIRRAKEPFGGVQVVMFGDLFQLPPVVKREDKEILSAYYHNFYFFSALVFRNIGFRVVELTHIFRQTDKEFVNILNHIRSYHIENEELDMLSELRDKDKAGNYNNDHIHICTHRYEVDKINQTMLGSYSHTYKATFDGQFPESSMPCDMELNLRIGARVMALSNNREKKYYNGMLGYVIGLDEDKVTAKMDNGNIILFTPNTWENTQYEVAKGKVTSSVIGTCKQIPLTLAWAITVHKSQGLTFDKIVLHASRTFCPGQLYVALSRCRTMGGIVSDSYITKQMILPSKELAEFERQYQQDGYYQGLV